jgi:hypothetical protein
MYPYPSSDLHIGHAEVHAIDDAIGRFTRLRGHNRAPANGRPNRRSLMLVTTARQLWLVRPGCTPLPGADTGRRPLARPPARRGPYVWTAGVWRVARTAPQGGTIGCYRRPGSRRQVSGGGLGRVLARVGRGRRSPGGD